MGLEPDKGRVQRLFADFQMVLEVLADAGQIATGRMPTDSR